MTKSGEPIATARLKGSKDSGIAFSLEFRGWEAAVAAGATLDEMEKWDDGGYSRKFMAKVIQWHEDHQHVENHKRAASMPKTKR